MWLLLLWTVLDKLLAREAAHDSQARTLLDLLIRERKILVRDFKKRVRQLRERCRAQLRKEVALGTRFELFDLDEPSLGVDVHLLVALEWWRAVEVERGPFEEVDEVCGGGCEVSGDVRDRFWGSGVAVSGLLGLFEPSEGDVAAAEVLALVGDDACAFAWWEWWVCGV